MVKCYDCGKSFFNESFFEAHVKRRHPKENITNQNDIEAERVSNVTPAQVNPAKTNVIGGTGNINRKTDSSGVDDDDVTNDELLAAVAEAEAQIRPAEPCLGGPNPYPKSKEGSVTGEKKNKVTVLKITTLVAVIPFSEIRRGKSEVCRLWAYQRFYQHLTGQVLVIEHCRIWQCWDLSIGIMLPYFYWGKLTLWWLAKSRPIPLFFLLLKSISLSGVPFF